MRYTLVDKGYPWKTIRCGHKDVGRVVRHADERHYIGVIGKTMVTRDNERLAFADVCALEMGFANAEALAAANTRVRHRNRSNRAEARHVLREIMNGNFKPLDELFRRDK